MKGDWLKQSSCIVPEQGSHACGGHCLSLRKEYAIDVRIIDYVWHRRNSTDIKHASSKQNIVKRCEIFLLPNLSKSIQISKESARNLCMYSVTLGIRNDAAIICGGDTVESLLDSSRIPTPSLAGVRSNLSMVSSFGVVSSPRSSWSFTTRLREFMWANIWISVQQLSQWGVWGLTCLCSLPIVSPPIFPLCWHPLQTYRSRRPKFHQTHLRSHPHVGSVSGSLKLGGLPSSQWEHGSHHHWNKDRCEAWPQQTEESSAVLKILKTFLAKSQHIASHSTKAVIQKSSTVFSQHVVSRHCLRRREGSLFGIYGHHIGSDSCFWLVATTIISAAIAHLTHTCPVYAAYGSSVRRAPKETTTAPSVTIAGVSYMSCALSAHASHGTKTGLAATLWGTAHCWPSSGRAWPKSATSTRMWVAVEFCGFVASIVVASMRKTTFGHRICSSSGGAFPQLNKPNASKCWPFPAFQEIQEISRKRLYIPMRPMRVYVYPRYCNHLILPGSRGHLKWNMMNNFHRLHGWYRGFVVTDLDRPMSLILTSCLNFFTLPTYSFLLPMLCQAFEGCCQRGSLRRFARRWIQQAACSELPQLSSWKVEQLWLKTWWFYNVSICINVLKCIIYRHIRHIRSKEHDTT